MPMRCVSVSEPNWVSFSASPDPGTLRGRGLAPGYFLDESGHCHTLCYQACSRMMHDREKLAPRIVDRCNLPHVHFNLFVSAERRAPGMFCFGDPWASESACELQAAQRAILMNCDS